jgi:WD40 repeat protein
MQATYDARVTCHLHNITRPIDLLLNEKSNYITLHTNNPTRCTIFLGEFEQYIATSHKYSGIKVWDIDRIKVVGSIEITYVTDMLSVGSNYLACVSGKTTSDLYIYKWKDGTLLLTIVLHEHGAVSMLTFGDSYLLYAAESTSINLYNISTGEWLKQAPCDDIKSIEYYSNCRFLSCHIGGTIKVWSLDTFSVLTTYESSNYISRDMQPSMILISDGIVLQTEYWFFYQNYLWDLNDKKKIIEKYANGLSRARYIGGKYAIGINKNEEACLWDMNEDEILFKLKIGSKFLNQLVIGRKNGLLALASDANYVRIYHAFKSIDDRGYLQKLMQCTKFLDVSVNTC